MSKLVFFTLLIFAARVSGQTNVSGLVAANTTWSLAGSPFIVTGNVLVLSGTTLTIEPGVEVRFNAGLILQVSGSLIANGTPSSHITFTANTLTPSKGFWNYIYLTGPNAGLYINDAAISSFFDYCDVKYGGSGGKGSIRAENATARITNCAIQESSSQGLTFKNSPTTVQYCFINNNSGAGIDHETDPRNITNISQNIISYNGGLGILFESIGAFDLHINNNRIRANGGGVSVDQGGGSGSTKVYLENNLIDSNITSSTPSAIYIGQGFHMYIIGDTITNNVSSGSYLIYLKYGWNPYVNSIKNNYIANNKSTSSDLMFYYYSVSYANTTFDFTDNTIKDNTASNGAIFTMYGNNGYLGFNFNISGNNIVNNTANATFNLIKFSGSINNNSIYNTVAYEIRNQNLAAEPTINAKNNFWSRTRAALDGYVYDYFDDGNLSLVLFDPVITSLPLTLLNFDGTKNGNLLHLKWQTFNEINSSLFNVQRSADGANFHNVGKVKAVGSSENNYVFTDSASLNSLVIYYRLQSVDKDGFKVFSQIIKLELTDKHALSIYPNPVKSFFTIKGSHINQVRITNSEGKLLGVYEFNDGTNPVINAAMLASGSYIVTINADGNKMSTTLKFLKN